MHTDKDAMALYVRVVEAGSFSKAAAREAMPVSTVSRKMAELEKSLGVRLLERSTRQLRMTEIGQGYFESCRRGLTEFEAADSLVTQRQAEIAGERIPAPRSTTRSRAIGRRQTLSINGSRNARVLASFVFFPMRGRCK